MRLTRSRSVGSSPTDCVIPPPPETHLFSYYRATLSITANHTLSGKAVSGTPLKMTVKTDSEYLMVDFTAPYYDGSENSEKHSFFQT